jgi:hypothetical protein
MCSIVFFMCSYRLKQAIKFVWHYSFNFWILRKLAYTYTMKHIQKWREMNDSGVLTWAPVSSRTTIKHNITTQLTDLLSPNNMRQSNKAFIIDWAWNRIEFNDDTEKNKQILLQTIPALLGFQNNEIEKKLRTWCSLKDVLDLCQGELHKSVRNYYEESWLRNETKAILDQNKNAEHLDELIVKYFYEKSGRWEHYAWNTVFPSTRDKDTYWFNCMFWSTMLHMMLEDAWYKNVQNITMDWPHNLLARKTEDGKLKIYDFYLYNERNSPFIHECSKEERSENSASSWWSILQTTIPHYPWWEVFNIDWTSNEQYSFYAFPSDNIADLSLYLKDISQIWNIANDSEVDDNDEMKLAARELTKKLPMLQYLDYDILSKTWWLFDPYPLLKKSHKEILLWD